MVKDSYIRDQKFDTIEALTKEAVLFVSENPVSSKGDA